MKILSLEQIKEKIDIQQIITDQIEGFKAYSKGNVNIPPVGYLDIPEAQGEYHLKYGMLLGDDVFVVKLAGGFYQNPKLYNIPSVQGMMIVFSAKTGEPLVLLNDGGYLTNLRTAIAGLLAAMHLAPKPLHAIGIIGTGLQARMQLQILKEWTKCRILWVWGRDTKSVNSYRQDMTMEGFQVNQGKCPSEVAKNCNLLITVTPSHIPLLTDRDIQPGTHITAVGADSPYKQELDPEIFARADICVVDSKIQCLDHGEISHAINKGIIQADKILELGQIMENPESGRNYKHPDQITVCDLTGVAFQDIQIAKSIAKGILADLLF